MKPFWIVIGLLVLGAWVVMRLVNAPPDWRGRGLNHIEVMVRGDGEGRDDVSYTSSDAAVVDRMLKLIARGRPTSKCLCAPLGAIYFTGPAGEKCFVTIRPGHAANEIQFDHDGVRYNVRRRQFMEILAPMNIPADRWDFLTPTSRPSRRSTTQPASD